jgi:hypothetical protein
MCVLQAHNPINPSYGAYRVRDSATTTPPSILTGEIRRRIFLPIHELPRRVVFSETQGEKGRQVQQDGTIQS